MINVIVCGATGKMGSAVIKAVEADSDLCLVGAIDVSNVGKMIKEVLPDINSSVLISNNLDGELKRLMPQVVIDFTNPSVVYENAKTIIKNGAYAVIGTTGLTAEQRDSLKVLAAKHNVGVLVAPNFSLGAVLMMKISEEIANYLPDVEIIELHHNEKKDAPSGTAKLTAEKISSVYKKNNILSVPNDSIEDASRGKTINGIHIHSVRLPGYIAHQQVLFGGFGETLSIRHDSINRESFMPGVILACKKIINTTGLYYGLEHFL